MPVLFSNYIFTLLKDGNLTENYLILIMGNLRKYIKGDLIEKSIEINFTKLEIL